MSSRQEFKMLSRLGQSPGCFIPHDLLKVAGEVIPNSFTFGFRFAVLGQQSKREGIHEHQIT